MPRNPKQSVDEDDSWAFGSGGFGKLYGDRLAESSLLECEIPTRWVFCFMLSQADSEGRFRCASVKGLARCTAIGVPEAERAVAELEAPDPDSTSPNDDGRRIRRIPGGWQIVNYVRYRTYGQRGASDEPGYVYFIRSANAIKIGYSRNPWARLKELSVAMPTEPELMLSQVATRQVELELHKRFQASHLKGEWFSPSKELLDYIATHRTTKNNSRSATSRDAKTKHQTPNTKRQTQADTPEIIPEDLGDSDSASAGIGSRYVRGEGDLAWFNPDDSLSWRDEAAVELERMFPAKSRQLARRGEDWLSELRGLSVWHATAPKSKKKRVSAHRWLMRLFKRQEKNALHAEKYRPRGSPVRDGFDAGGMYQGDEERRTSEARKAACPVDHERDFVDGGGKIRYCPQKCGWVQPVGKGET